MITDWYFPQSVHERAHREYIVKTGCTPDELRQHCLENLDFFFDVTFAHVENLPPPKLKK